MSFGFVASISKFLEADTDQIIGALANAAARSGLATSRNQQTEAWQNQIAILRDSLRSAAALRPGLLEGDLILEFEIPRRQKRPDVVLLIAGTIYLIEFKVGANEFDAASRWQVEEYALNLRDFHSASADRLIIPILCATEAQGPMKHRLAVSGVAPLQLCGKDTLADVLGDSLQAASPMAPLYVNDWLNAPYRPTLTIIEAAERLYETNDVREINHSYAENLTRTTDLLAELVAEARAKKRRYICFVTGVPGAGKTLTGLNLVHDPRIRAASDRSGIFLSGNGPLVKILRAAIVQDQRRRTGRPLDILKHEVSTFVQNLHQFLRSHLENPKAVPHENLVVFDEAQRAWNRRQMLKKQKVDASEPSLLLDVMTRVEDWCVIVALVGGGQEIFLGEAGLAEWGRALNARQGEWTVVASREALMGGTSVAGHTLFSEPPRQHLELQANDAAHLKVSLRSHRAQRLATWVNNLLLPDASTAKDHLPDGREFPICLTKNLDTARKWLRQRSAGEPHCRCGLVASSEDQRLRAYGLEQSSGFRLGYPFDKWFLAGPSDTRSSFQLEVSASEFECQGLELDWVGVCWGGDLTLCPDRTGWDFRKFRGTRWQQSHSGEEHVYIQNRYRVLLTRARLGMVIWVPQGIREDPTLDPARFDRVSDLLLRAGVENLDARSN